MKNPKSFISALPLLLSVLTAAPLAFAADSPPIRLDHNVAKAEIAVEIRDQHFTTFHYGSEVRTPFLWPINAEGGVGVTRNFPMGTDDPESTDHTHHRSLFLTFGDVNGHDFWHHERISTQSVETGSGKGYVWIRAQNEWLSPDDDPVLREVQELRFYDSPASGRFFDLISTLEAAYGDVTLGDDKEGFMAFRVRPEIEGDRGGILTNAEGKQGEEATYGLRSAWFDYSGEIEGHGIRGLSLFDHPGNFRHPTFWHVRDYGLAAANPFASHSVGGEEEAGTHTLKRGESLTFVYRIYVHSGDVQEAGVAENFEAFSQQSDFQK